MEYEKSASWTALSWIMITSELSDTLQSEMKDNLKINISLRNIDHETTY